MRPRDTPYFFEASWTLILGQGRSKRSRRDDAKREHPGDTSSDKSHGDAGVSHKIAQKRALLRTRESQALESYARGRLAPDHLLHVIQLNVFRGMLSNASLLRLEVDFLICTAFSPFGRMGPDRPGAPARSVPPCPANLAPTALQLRVPHHPWVDLFPLPRMRDNLLLALDGRLSDEDDEQLWNDLMESGAASGAEWYGLIVWGAPWDPWSWEATLPFLERWGWLVEGCPELVESTNYWRRRRGEECLQSPSVKATY